MSLISYAEVKSLNEDEGIDMQEIRLNLINQGHEDVWNGCLEWIVHRALDEIVREIIWGDFDGK